MRPLPMRLQIPMAVALLSIGNILLSLKLAKYDVKKAIAIPNYDKKIAAGILVWKFADSAAKNSLVRVSLEAISQL